MFGLGGGSSLDTAKLVALLAPGRETLADVFGVGKAKGPRLPLILAPTTAGTGSEVTPISIVTTGENEKMGVVSPVILPDVALLDPELTLGLPPHVTAATGIDAMVHAIEAYASMNANNNPVSRILATQALTLLGRSIETAVHNGGDLAARSDMLLGSMLAGRLSPIRRSPPCTRSPIRSAGIFTFRMGCRTRWCCRMCCASTPRRRRGVYAEIAPFAFPELARLEGQARAEAFCDAFSALSLRCGLPARLRDLDVPEAVLPRLARDAMNQTRLLPNNPRPVTEADALEIYRRAW